MRVRGRIDNVDKMASIQLLVGTGERDQKIKGNVKKCNGINLCVTFWEDWSGNSTGGKGYGTIGSSEGRR